MTIQRTLQKELIGYIERKEAHSNTLLLSGARQVGKSTLVDYVTKDHPTVKVNLFESTTFACQIDSTETFEEFERLLLRELNFSPSKGTLLVIDEAQEARRLGRWIGFFKEKWADQKVIVLGSILSNLFGEGVSYPVGRVEELVLRPFSFAEFLTAIGKSGLLRILESSSLEKPLVEADRISFIKPYLSYLRCGGMPEVVVRFSEGTENIYPIIDRLLSHYATDIERYMKEPFKAMFLTAMQRIADVTSHPIKQSQIISTDSPSYRKLPALLEVMEKWNLVHKISARTKHPESSSGLASKRYLFDVGFTNLLINRGLPIDWTDREGLGNLIFPKLQENFICNEIVSAFGAESPSLLYYRETRNSKEIDLLVRFEKGILPIEVKSTSKISRNALLPMVSYLEQSGQKAGMLVYNGEMRKINIRGKNIYAVPPFMIGYLFFSRQAHNIFI